MSVLEIVRVRRVANVEACWRGTYTKKLESFESLAWYDSHNFHFAQECNLWGREPRWKWQCHGCDA